jgi:hypothetical protein
VVARLTAPEFLSVNRRIERVPADATLPVDVIQFNQMTETMVSAGL